ncbi:MAG: hypothetical protein DRO11_09370 [Methanobacteriota archaeon]|nr:MAG: hypothetical protein DRO11_09370 [Euryarchaeota archaeon]
MAHHHGYKNIFRCPKCGYKNYVTREDIERRKAKLLANRIKDEPKLKGLYNYFQKIWYKIK